MTIKIRKRQGYLVNYDREQLYHSISPVVQTAKEQSQVVCYCDSKIKALDGIKQHLSIEELLDLVQNSLLELNLKDEAARFASYREERKRVREAKKIKVDVESTIEDYVGQLDWRVNENANQGYSIGGMILNTSGKVTANYWLSSVYPERVGQAHRDGRIHIHDLSFLGCYCLAGSTKIRLLDGRVKSIKWLAENMQNEEFEVMSYDLDKMEPAVGTAYKPRLTRKHAETITLVLDNGKKLTCTPDHKILTRDGVYVEAGNLHIGDSLMPMNIKMNPLFRRLSISTYSVARKKPVRGQLHRVIFELANRKLKKNEIVHHINGNKFDNRTCNLQAMDDSEHRAMEFAKTNSRPDVKAKYSALLSAYNKSDEKRKLASKFAKSRKRDAEGRFVNIHNHKVVAIKKGTTQDVYCMTVKNYHNFAIDAGIVVKNCCGWDLKRLLDEGLNGLKGHIDSKPPKNLSGAVGQMVNALGVLQNEAAGAQAYSSADTYLAPFVRELKKKIINEYTDVIGMTGGTVDVNINADRLKAYVDEKLHKEVYQCIQELIFNLNVPSRWGSQTPFTNLTFDLTCPEDLKDRKPKIGGVEVEDYTYGDLQEEMNLLNNVFVEVYMKGDAKGQPFTFPIPTYNITKDFDWNSKFVDSVFEMAAKYGLPYFQNFMSSDMKPSDVRSMCVTGDTIVRGSIRKNRKWKKTGPIAISELLSYDLEDIKIQSSKGLKRLKRKLINDFNGNLIKITTDSGKTLTMTPDHPQLVYNDEDELVIVQAKMLKVGDKVSTKYGTQFCTESRRLGKSYEEQYGKKRAAVLKAEYSEQRSGKAAWNSGVVLTAGQKSCISEGLLGHAVSELTKAKSSKRWLGKKNPVLQQEYWDRNSSKAMIQMSVYEKPFKKELESLGLEFVYQYVVGKHIADFYIPKKNLIIELESKWKHGVQYNNADLFRGKHKYFLEHGYNVLVLNPKTDTAYRKYINRVDTIVKIEKIKSKCKVYDVEIDNSKDAKSESHEFYANGILTHNCCRLRLDKRELLKRGNGLFGSAEQTGSIGVVTINLARLGYKHKGDLEGLYKELDELLIIAKDSLEIKRAIVSKLLEQGFYPALSRYLSHFNNHFSTIGINGGNEMIRNFTNDEEDISTEYGQKMMLDMMDYLRQRMADFQEETGNLYNLEAAPCEGAMYRFALADKKAFGDDIIQAGPKEAPYYTNSSQLPVSFTDDIFEALDLQNDLQCKYTGGTVLHLYMAERVSSADVAKTLVRKIFENYTLPYITFTPTFSICPIHGYLAGEHEYCPICDAEIEKRAQASCNCETEKTI